jgi:hypothetical protein
MYEKTVAAIQKIYQINFQATPTKVVDLLSPQDKEEYLAILGGVGNYPTNPIHNIRDNYRRIVVDGYIISTSPFYASTKIGGAQEPVPANVQYTSPVVFWLENLLVSGSGSAIIRIFFS